MSSTEPAAPSPRRPRLLIRARTAVYPWIVSLGLLSAWAVVTLLGSGGVDVTGNVIGTDFLGLYAGAAIVDDDPSADPYRPDEVRAKQVELVPGMRDGDVVPYLSPPPALLLYRPLTSLSFSTALTVWWLANLAGWVAALEILRRAMGRGAWTLRQMLVGTLWFAPFLIGFFFAQATGIVAAIWAATILLLVRGREAAAGGSLALLVFKPQLALGLALPLLVRGRWRGLVAGGAVTLLLLTLSWVIWPEQWRYVGASTGYAIEVITDGGYPTWGVVSLFGFLQLLLGPVIPELVLPLTLLLTVVCLVLLTIAWHQIPWEPAATSWRLAMAGTAVAGLLLGVHLFTYDLALAMLAFWLVVDALDLPPGQDPALDGGPVLRWAALLWALAFAGPYVTLAIQSLLDRMGLPPITVGVTTIGFAAASLALWKEAVQRRTAGAR